MGQAEATGAKIPEEFVFHQLCVIDDNQRMTGSGVVHWVGGQAFLALNINSLNRLLLCNLCKLSIGAGKNILFLLAIGQKGRKL